MHTTNLHFTLFEFSQNRIGPGSSNGSGSSSSKEQPIQPVAGLLVLQIMCCIYA